MDLEYQSETGFGEKMLEVREEGRKTQSTHEDLLGNTIMELGSNMRVLAHPDVDGLRVRRDSSGCALVVEVFAFRITQQLRSIIREEFGSHRILLHHKGWGLVFD